MKSIILTGGTGFLGGEFIKAFHSHYQIYSIYRSDCPQSVPNVHWIFANLENKSDIDTLISKIPQKIDYIVHIGGASPNRAYADGNFNATIIGTRNLVSLAQKLHQPHFIYLSTLSVTSGYAGPYVNSKLDAENTIKNSGLKYTIFRPTTILGPLARDFKRILASLSRFPVCPVVGDGSFKVQPISASDICKIISDTIDHPHLPNQTYDLAGHDCLSQKQFMSKIASHYHRHFLFLPLPSKVLVFISRIIEKINPLLGINEERVRLQMQSVCLDPAILEKEFHLRLQSLDAILSDSISPSR